MKDYTAMNNWRTVNGDMGRTLTVVVLRKFKVPFQQLFGVPTENHKNCQIVLSVS